MMQAANLERDVREVIRRRILRPKPVRLICIAGRIIADATVIVSPADPNWYRGMGRNTRGLIEVRADTRGNRLQTLTGH